MSTSSGNSNTTCDELKQALKYAKSFQEGLKKFQEMQTQFEGSDSQFGSQILQVGSAMLYNDLEQVLIFAKKALTIVTKNNSSCLLISRVLRLLGFANLHLRMFDESLSYLNRAEKSLSKLDQTDLLLDTALEIQTDLCNLKKAMGRNQDVIVHAKKLLEIKEKMMEEGCVELGKANKVVYDAYFFIFNMLDLEYDLKGALPYCLKAQEIFVKCLGPDSVEVAEVMKNIAVIYYKSGELEKALAQNRLAASIFKKTAPNSPDLRTADINYANMLITVHRFGEAIDLLQDLLHHTDDKGHDRAILTFAMARAFFGSKKSADAKYYMRKAQGMLEKKGVEPDLVATAFVEMSQMYEKMHDLDTAISMIKKALAVPEIPSKLFKEHSVRLFSLMSLSGKDQEEIPYMEGVVKKLKKSVDPHDLTLLKLSHGLSLAYAGSGRFLQALEIEEKVAKGLKGLAPSELGFMHDVTKHLSKMRKRVAESPTAASFQSKDEGGLSAEFSKCGTSDDGKALK